MQGKTLTEFGREGPSAQSGAERAYEGCSLEAPVNRT